VYNITIIKYGERDPYFTPGVDHSKGSYFLWSDIPSVFLRNIPSISGCSTDTGILSYSDILLNRRQMILPDSVFQYIFNYRNLKTEKVPFFNLELLSTLGISQDVQFYESYFNLYGILEYDKRRNLPYN